MMILAEFLESGSLDYFLQVRIWVFFMLLDICCISLSSLKHFVSSPSPF